MKRVLLSRDEHGLIHSPDTKLVRLACKIVALILLGLVFYGCRPGDQTEAVPTSQPTPKKLTVFLIDQSGSFHYVQRGGHFSRKNYFYLACDEVKKYVQTQADQHNELIIVRAIQSASFSDDTFVARLDYTKSARFTEPEPQGAYTKEEKKAWEIRRQSFEAGEQKKLKVAVDAFLADLDTFRKQQPSGKTDLVNAFRVLIPHLKQYDSYSKRIVVYSDFRETEISLGAAGEIDLGNDTEVEGRFVSMNDQSSDSYHRLLKEWQKIIKCKSLKFLGPAESV